jgi:hypothetical protein
LLSTGIGVREIQIDMELLYTFIAFYVYPVHENSVVSIVGFFLLLLLLILLLFLILQPFDWLAALHLDLLQAILFIAI